MERFKNDGFEKSPHAALCFKIRYCNVPASTSHSSFFARLAFGSFYKTVTFRTVYDLIKNNMIYTTIGLSGGLSGLLTASRCTGNGCSSCFGCAAVGLGILSVAVFNKLRGASGKP